VNILSILASIVFLTLFIYAIFLLSLGIVKMLSFATDSMRDYQKPKGIKYYIGFFFVDKVNKSISHRKIIAASTILAILVCIAIFVTKK
jgi:hypothetical protein